MRKGFTVALLTVAIAILGSNAMSVAPVISEIKDIIVSDDTPVSGANHFVFPDAIDLDTVVSDTDTADDQLVWSYVESTGKYTVNDRASLDLGVDDEVSPPAAKIIAGPGATAGDDPDSVDADLFTITLRNVDLSPIAGPDVDPPGTGIIASETRTMTFFVSDGELASSDTIIVYTEDDSVDGFSPRQAAGDPVYNPALTAGTQDWVFENTQGGITQSNGSSGICLTAPAAGDNIAKWDSPYGDVQLVDNAVYRIRTTMNTTQTAENAVPLWNIGIINTRLGGAGPSGAFGALAYGGSYWYLDNVGGAEGIGRFRSTFTQYFTPPPVALASWRSTATGAFQPDLDAFNDMQFSFRVFDVGSSGYNANLDSGTVCLEAFEVVRFDLADLTENATLWSDSDLQSSEFSTSQGFGETSFTFSGGNLTIAPQNPGTSWGTAFDSLFPGAGNLGDGASPLNTTDWPLPHSSDQLFLFEVEVSAPSAAARSQQPDIILLTIQAGGNQLYHEGYVLPNKEFGGQGPAGAAPVGTPEAYTMFGHSNEESKASNFDAMRPGILIQNIPEQAPANPTGSFTIHSMSVKDVSF